MSPMRVGSGGGRARVSPDPPSITEGECMRDVSANTEDRFWQKVLVVEDCWQWIGAVTVGDETLPAKRVVHPKRRSTWGAVKAIYR